MKLNIAQVIGLNTDQKAAQVISAARDGETYFFAVLHLTCDDAFTKGRQVLSELSDFFFDFEGTPAEKLKATFAETQKKFDEDLPAGRQEFSILLASIYGKILYLESKGLVEVYLKRSEKLSTLLSAGAPSQLISGFLNEDDRLLFATQSLTSFLGDDIGKALNLPIETFEEEMAMRIGGSSLENQGLAALSIEVIAEGIVDLPNLQEEPPVSATGDSDFSLDTHQDSTALLRFLRQKTYRLIKSGKGRLLVAVALIMVIALGAGFKIKAAKDVERETTFNQAVQSAQDDLNNAKGLSTLNPSEAKSKLDQAKAKVEQALNLKPTDNHAQDLKKQIEQDASQILKQSSVADFPLFLDMDLVKKNFRAKNFSFSAGKLLLLDEEITTLVVLDVAKKSNQILAGSAQLGEAATASLNGDLAFVYSQDKGILRADSTNQKITSVTKKDKEWGDIADIFGFAGNVYLLDSAKNMIWKYLPTTDGYSDKREYLSKNTKADLTNALRMQIESSIYVLKSGGEILRFTRGEQDNFSYGGLDKGVKDPKSFFVSSDTDNLYLLDSGNSRLLILTKTGSLKAQMAGEKFGSASDLVVDEKEKKVYLLDGSKIYTVDLK